MRAEYSCLSGWPVRPLVLSHSLKYSVCSLIADLMYFHLLFLHQFVVVITQGCQGWSRWTWPSVGQLWRKELATNMWSTKTGKSLHPRSSWAWICTGQFPRHHRGLHDGHRWEEGGICARRSDRCLRRNLRPQSCHGQQTRSRRIYHK